MYGQIKFVRGLLQQLEPTRNRCFCRAYRSLDYEEDTHQNILRSEYLWQDGDRTETGLQLLLYGLRRRWSAELIVRNMGLYGIKIRSGTGPGSNLFLSFYSSYGYSWGPDKYPGTILPFLFSPFPASKPICIASRVRGQERQPGFLVDYRCLSLMDDVGSSESTIYQQMDYSDGGESQKAVEEPFSAWLQEAPAKRPSLRLLRGIFQHFIRNSRGKR